MTKHGPQKRVLIPPGKGFDPAQLAKSGTEHGTQAALFAWAANEIFTGRYPELRLMYAVPNGGERNKIVASNLKAEGVKPGVPDVVLPVARHGVHGLYIEMKRPGSVGRRKGKAQANQIEWIDELRKQGYGACVCVGWEAARDVLIQYLK